MARGEALTAIQNYMIYAWSGFSYSGLPWAIGVEISRSA